MILVTLGTQDKPFTRLLEAIEQYMIENDIHEECIVQAGTTKYQSEHMKVFDFIPVDQFDDLLQKADMLIMHAGVGSILSAVKLHKKVLAAARLSKYGEHTNDHQVEILEEFKKQGYILALTDFSLLKEKIEELKTFQPAEYHSNTQRVTNYIQAFIDTIDE